MEKSMGTLLKVEELKVSFQGTDGRAAVDGVSFSMEEGEILGVVGESGSGKTMTALAIMGLLPGESSVSGSIRLEGQELLTMKEDEKRHIQGSRMGMIFQEPMTSLNPVMKIGPQVGESLKLHTDLSKEEIRARTLEALLEAGLENPEEIYEKYPHQLSGGMRQRAMIAMAMTHSPTLLIADEPTTALDVLIQKQILTQIRKLHRERKLSVLFISHNLTLIRSICDRVLVMRQGRLIEQGDVRQVFERPSHEYTRQLVGAMKGGLGLFVPGEKVLSVENLEVFYRNRGLGIFKKREEQQVIHGISFQVRQGEIFGIAGESGCGKSTLARVIAGIHSDYRGSLYIKEGIRPQMVFQDPFGSLNPARKIGWIMEEPLRLRGIRDQALRGRMARDMLEDMGLDDSFALRHPRELSGGQRQRVSIGLALLMDSGFLIADEPVSALDVTIQGQIMELLLKINQEKNVTILLITHDLSLIERYCHRAAVLREGRIVEMGEGRQLCRHPEEAYTRSLVEAAVL